MREQVNCSPAQGDHICSLDRLPEDYYIGVYSTYRTVGKDRRPFTPIRTLFAQYSHSRRIVLTAILTLFALYSHGCTLFAQSHTIRTHFARSHTIRAVHTLFAPSSHQIRTLFALFF